MVYERQLIEMVGLNTYKAMLRLFPDLFKKQYNDGYPISLYYIQLVQSVLSNNRMDGNELRRELDQAVNMKNNGEDISKMRIYPLVNSSKVPRYYSSGFLSNALWFLVVSLFSIFLVWILISFFQNISLSERRVETPNFNFFYKTKN